VNLDLRDGPYWKTAMRSIDFSSTRQSKKMGGRQDDFKKIHMDIDIRGFSGGRTSQPTNTFSGEGTGRNAA
jgi:hypothetical protein